jgi:NAD(P)-dependent dehydrogenase (short-subunit alcohol dehydrogenase family)
VLSVSDPSLTAVCKGEDLGYRMSKAALNMLTVTLAEGFQMNGDNVAVIALNPGYVATRLTDFRSRDDSYG